MPEGDTIYQAAKRLDKALTGQVLTSSDFRIPSLATSDISGTTVTGTVSRGKHLLTRFDNELSLRTHLKMDGIWQVDPGLTVAQPGHTARVVLRTATTEAVGFQVMLDLSAPAPRTTWSATSAPTSSVPTGTPTSHLHICEPIPRSPSVTPSWSNATSPASATCTRSSSASSPACTR